MHALNARREAAILALLAVIGGLLLACGVWVTGADAMIETLRSSGDAAQTPEVVPADATPTPMPTSTVPAPGEVEGGPDAAPTD